MLVCVLVFAALDILDGPGIHLRTFGAYVCLMVAVAIIYEKADAD